MFARESDSTLVL